jgi:hypothetical protein
MAGYPDILADTVVVNNSGNIATVNFDLSGKDTGLYHLVIKNPDSSEKRFPNSFTIEQGSNPELWVDIIGRNAVRNGRPFTFQVAYGNEGNVDGKGVILWVAVPRGVKSTPNFTIFGQDSTFILNDSIEFFVDVDIIGGMRKNMRVYPLFIPRIEGNSVHYISFTIDSIGNQDLDLIVWINSPLYQSPLKYLFGECIDNLLGLAAGLSPGISCVYSILDLTLSPLVDLAVYGYDPKNNLTIFNPQNPKYSFPLAMAQALFSMATSCTVGYDIPKIKPIVEKILTSIINTAEVGLTANDIAGTHESCKDGFDIPDYVKKPIANLFSFDPNEKLGPEKFHNTNSPFVYTILFENKDLATAAAQEVRIIDTIDKAKFNISTFSFGDIAFGDTIVHTTHQFDKQFSQQIDLRPAKNLIVEAEGRVDTVKGIAYWKFLSLDPATMLLTEDPLLGFLPPNVNSPEGEGWVSFNIRPYDSLQTGEELKNRASIIFDFNEPIVTNLHENVIDKISPISKMQPLTPVQSDSNFVVKWTGSDNLSGVQYYDVYVAEDSGSFSRWLTHITDTFAVYSGRPKHEYRFYTISTDNAGNIEGSKTAAEAMISVGTSALPLTLLNFSLSARDNRAVQLLWQTTNEINTSHFEVEHSLDGRTFFKIGSVKSANNPAGQQNYEYAHLLNKGGVHYYRLKLVDNDGKFSYSKVLWVQVDRLSYESFVVFPNPVKSVLSILGENIRAVLISDISGKLLLQKNTVPSSLIKVDVSSLGKGVYIVSVQNNSGLNETKKVFIY